MRTVNTQFHQTPADTDLWLKSYYLFNGYQSSYCG